jgi:uncharacterized cupredoxin-like copper-binding protein
MRRSIFLLPVLVVLAAAGCGSSDNGTTGGAAADTGGGGQRIEVSATDFHFDPPDITAEAGEVTFVLKNDGQTGHALEIEGEGVEEETDTIEPGQTAELTVDLKDGTYEFYCPVDGHKEQGMEGTVTVGSGGAGSGSTDTGMEDTSSGSAGSGY